MIRKLFILAGLLGCSYGQKITTEKSHLNWLKSGHYTVYTAISRQGEAESIGNEAIYPSSHHLNVIGCLETNPGSYSHLKYLDEFPVVLPKAQNSSDILYRNARQGLSPGQCQVLTSGSTAWTVTPKNGEGYQGNLMWDLFDRTWFGCSISLVLGSAFLQTVMPYEELSKFVPSLLIMPHKKLEVEPKNSSGQYTNYPFADKNSFDFKGGWKDEKGNLPWNTAFISMIAFQFTKGCILDGFVRGVGGVLHHRQEANDQKAFHDAWKMSSQKGLAKIYENKEIKAVWDKAVDHKDWSKALSLFHTFTVPEFNKNFHGDFPESLFKDFISKSKSMDVVKSKPFKSLENLDGIEPNKGFYALDTKLPLENKVTHQPQKEDQKSHPEVSPSPKSLKTVGRFYLATADTGAAFPSGYGNIGDEVLLGLYCLETHSLKDSIMVASSPKSLVKDRELLPTQRTKLYEFSTVDIDKPIKPDTCKIILGDNLQHSITRVSVDKAPSQYAPWFKLVESFADPCLGLFYNGIILLGNIHNMSHDPKLVTQKKVLPGFLNEVGEWSSGHTGAFKGEGKNWANWYIPFSAWMWFLGGFAWCGGSLYDSWKLGHKRNTTLAIEEIHRSMESSFAYAYDRIQSQDDLRSKAESAQQEGRMRHLLSLSNPLVAKHFNETQVKTWNKSLVKAFLSLPTEDKFKVDNDMKKIFKSFE
jgi:hypothetical protein